MILVIDIMDHTILVYYTIVLRRSCLLFDRNAARDEHQIRFFIALGLVYPLTSSLLLQNTIIIIVITIVLIEIVISVISISYIYIYIYTHIHL